MEFSKLMKLKVLAIISADLSQHLDNEVQRLITEREKNYDVNEIISYYATTEQKDPSLLKLKKVRRDIVEMKREVAFIIYMLNCPFFREYGINEIMKKEVVILTCESLNISRESLNEYIVSAKHFYRFYSEFRERITIYLNHFISNFNT